MSRSLAVPAIATTGTSTVPAIAARRTTSSRNSAPSTAHTAADASSRTATQQIEHIVAINEAHHSGMCTADIETKRTFAGDLLNLTLASPEVNGAKADWLKGCPCHPRAGPAGPGGDLPKRAKRRATATCRGSTRSGSRPRASRSTGTSAEYRIPRAWYGAGSAIRKHGHYWLAGDELGAGRAMARRDENVRVELLTKIEELYASAATRQNVENIEMQVLDTSYVTPFLSTGLQVHMPYTASAHWFLLHRILTGAGVEQIQLNSDIDSMTRAAFLTAYADEVKRGDAHAFFVQYTKWLTIDERERIQADSKRKLGQFATSAPGRGDWSKKKLASEMMKEYIAECEKHGK